MVSFEWLIEPIMPDVFFRDYYEHKPLLIEGRDPEKFRSLLSVEAIDRYLAASWPSYPDVFLVDAARELKPDDYSLPQSGRIDLPRAYQLFQSGATISLSQLQERLPPLAALCRAMEHVFSSHFQTNIYLSPRNAQGFKTHYDSHDVFVLQVSGSKHWTLYDTLIELPLHGQGFEPGKHIPGAATRELTIRAGDVFYCPRGLFHSARATDEVSLHITLGVMGKTWADVMVEAISEACLASPAFRANLPAGFANPGFDRTEAEATFRSLVEAFARNARLGPILDRFAESFVTSRRPAFEGCLAELDSPPQISRETRLVARPHLVYLLREEGDQLSVLFGSTQIALPSFTRLPLERALSGAPFQVSDLPGALDEPGKIVLVQRLIREGMLVRADGGTPTRPAGIAAV
jgi:mannose-6-phosphate isomerase-like protein (cupin superfamily)